MVYIIPEHNIFVHFLSRIAVYQQYGSVMFLEEEKNQVYLWLKEIDCNMLVCLFPPTHTLPQKTVSVSIFS